MKNVIAVMMTVLLLSACSEMKSTGSSSGSSSSLGDISVTSQAQIGERVVISSPRANEILGYAWTILNDLRVDITARCAPSRSSATLECFFYEVGRVEVVLQAQMRDGSSKTFINGLEVSDSPFGMNQPPSVVVKLTQGSSAAQLTNYPNQRDDVPQFYMNQPISFDLSLSTDDLDSALTYRVAIAGVAPATYTSANFTHSFSMIGTYGVTVDVTDSAGNVARKVFNILITCENTAVRQVVTGISATYDGVGNFWDYSVAHTRPRATAPFTYQWDFNGDGIMDTDWQAEPTVNLDKQTTFRGNRTITVLVKDNICNFVAPYTQVVNFDNMPKLTPVVVGTTDASTFTNGWTRHYIQAELTPNVNNPRLIGITNKDAAGVADFIAMYEGRLPNIANCEYSPANGTFIMRGLNFYKTPSREGVRNGLALEMSNLPRNPAVNQLMTSTSAVMNQARYYSDAAGDAQSQTIYNKTAASSCQLQVNVMRLPDGAVPCDGGSSVVNRTYRIYGTYSCPDLRTSTNLALSLEKGAWACEFAIADRCVGGGGGGGGGIDPILQ